MADADRAREGGAGGQDGGVTPGRAADGRGRGPPGDPRGLRAEADGALPLGRAEAHLVGGVGEQDVRGQGGELAPSGARGVRVDDGVGAARLEGGEEADEEFGPGADADGDEAARGQATVQQVVGQPVGAGVEFAVGEFLGAAQDGGGRGRVAGPLLEAFQDGVDGGSVRPGGGRCLRHAPMMPSGGDRARGW